MYEPIEVGSRSQRTFSFAARVLGALKLDGPLLIGLGLITLYGLVAKTVETGRAVYFSRSRQRLWFKGEESGHVQHVHEVRLDCDEDVVLLKVEQVSGIACHTGRHSCFFQKFEGSVDDGEWVAVDPVLKDPEHIYK